MEINISIKADDEADMAQKIDVALFKLGKELNTICRLDVDQQIEIAHVTVSRSA